MHLLVVDNRNHEVGLHALGQLPFAVQVPDGLRQQLVWAEVWAKERSSVRRLLAVKHHRLVLGAYHSMSHS